MSNLSFANICKRIRDGVMKTPLKSYIISLEESTKIKIEYVIIGLCLNLLVMVYVGVFDMIISNIIGYSYPFYATIASIEAVEDASHKDHDAKKWLTYWILFVSFTYLEVFHHTLTYWIPFYFIIKIIFLLWCMIPAFDGALFIYEQFFSPAVKSLFPSTAAPSSSTSSSNSTKKDKKSRPKEGREGFVRDEKKLPMNEEHPTSDADA